MADTRPSRSPCGVLIPSYNQEPFLNTRLTSHLPSLLLAALATSGAPAAAQHLLTEQIVPPPSPYTGLAVLKVNDQRHFVARTGTDGDLTYHIMFGTAPDHMVEIVAPDGQALDSIRGLNNHDTVIGTTADGNGFVWSPTMGWTALLALPGYRLMMPEGLNDADVVVGWTEASEGVTSFGKIRAFQWSPGQSLRVGQALISAFPAGINSSGQVAATQYVKLLGGDWAYHAVYVGARGHAIDLHDLDSHADIERSQAVAIDDRGDVALNTAGDADQGVSQVPAIWTKETGLQSLHIGAGEVIAMSQVGTILAGSLGNLPNNFVWDRVSGGHLLTDLVAPGQPVLQGLGATSISGHDLIGGYYTDPASRFEYGVILTPLP